MTKFYTHFRIAARAAVTLILISLFSPLVAQQAVLEMKLQKPDNTAASGTISITGTDTDITDDAFTGSATYTLKVATATGDMVDAVIRLFPNPADGVVTLDLPSALADATLEVRNAAGILLSNTTSSPVLLSGLTPGMLFFTLTNDEQKVTLKLLSKGSSLRINITGGTTDSDTGKGTVLKATSASSADDDYTITFSESTGNLDGQTWYRTVLLGQTVTIDEPLVWSNKEFILEGTTSNDATVTITSGGEELTTVATTAGVIPSTTLSKWFDSEIGLPVTIQVTAPFADEVSYAETAFPGETLTVDTMLNHHFNFTATVRNKDDNTVVTVYDNQDNTLAQGVADEELYIVQRKDEITNAKITLTATNAETKEINKNLQPGTNNINETINWIYKNKITGKEGATIKGIFNNKTIAEYTANGNEETKTFTDTLLTGTINWKQTKENYITTNQEKTITPGTNNTELEQMTGKYTITLLETKEEANITWKDEEENTLLTGTNATTLYKELPQDELNVQAIIKLTNYNNDTIKIINATPGTTTKTAEQMTGKYTRIITGTKNGDKITWKDLQENTLQTETDSILYEELQQDERSVKAIIERTNYNNDTTLYINTTPGTTTKKLEQMTGQYTTTINNVITGTNITWKDEEGKTILTGIDAITLYKELPQDSTTIKAILEKEGWKTDTTYFNNIKPGTNEEEANQEEKTYEHWLHSNNSNPEGAETKGWKNGTTILSAIFANGAYETNHITNNEETITLDSLITTATGYEKDKKINITLTEGGTQQDINLTALNEYNIKGIANIIGAIITEEPNEAIDTLKTGTIKIKTIKDGKEYDININENGTFNDTIKGTYNPTDSIIITYTNNPKATTNTFSILEANKPASTGKIRNDGYEEYLNEIWNPPEPYTKEDFDKLADFYVASIQATGFIQHEAKTTLEKITGKELYFVAMNDTAINNQDAIDMIRNVTNSGVGSYTQDTLIFVNYIKNISTGETISTQEQQEQQQAINLLEQEMTTRTGRPLAYTKKITATELGNPTKKSYVWKENTQATNAEYGNTPTTWEYSILHTRPSDPKDLIISELGGGSALYKRPTRLRKQYNRILTR